MENKNGLEDFFGSPFAVDYINSINYVIKRSVAGISAACDELADKKDRRSDEIAAGIMAMCRDLMRSAELSSALAAEKLSDDDLTAVRSDVFLERFAKGCVEASKGMCTVKIKNPPACCIKTDSELLRYLLLSFIRRCAAVGNGKKLTFEAECSESPKTLNIKISALRTFVDGDDAEQTDIFGAYHREVCMGLAQRIGARAELTDDSLTVVIPLADGNSPAALEAPAAEPESGSFNPFSIMLCDI